MSVIVATENSVLAGAECFLQIGYGWTHRAYIIWVHLSYTERSIGSIGRTTTCPVEMATAERATQSEIYASTQTAGDSRNNEAS